MVFIFYLVEYNFNADFSFLYAISVISFTIKSSIDPSIAFIYTVFLMMPGFFYIHYKDIGEAIVYLV